MKKKTAHSPSPKCLAEIVDFLVKHIESACGILPVLLRHEHIPEKIKEKI